MSKDSVKNRLETGLSFTEFSYQLLQAYDFQHMYQNDNCRFQMGGSDQWGNITSGTEFIKKNLVDAKAYAVTSKLLTKTDGKKFGKSESGNIWLDPNMTSPYQFYQFWINADDADLASYIRYFTLKSRKEVEEMEADLKDDPRAQKKILAEELTNRIHSPEDCAAVRDVSEILFNRKMTAETIKGMGPESLRMVSKEIPSFTLDKSLLSDAIPLENLMTEHCPVFSSLGEFRRAVKNNAVSVNKLKINESGASISSDDLIADQYIMIENGKKNKYILSVE